MSGKSKRGFASMDPARQRAIASNPANRLAALQDDDLERLLQDDDARAALEGRATRTIDHQQ